MAHRSIAISLSVIFLSLLMERPAIAKPPVVARKPQADVRRWVGWLGHRSSDVRQLATRQLVRAGARAVPAMRAAVNSPDAEVAARAERILLRLIFSPQVADSDAARAAVLQLATSRNRRVKSWAIDLTKRIESIAVQTLQQNGVAVSFEYDARGRQVARVDMSRWRGGDRSLINLRFLGRISLLDLSKARISNDGLRWLREHTSITVLDLRETGIGDRGLRSLAKLADLRELDLRETRVTGAGLVFLKNLAKVQSLHLGDTQLSGAGLRHLAALKNLHKLNLSCTRLTDADLKPLAEFRQLQQLWLSHTQIGDAGLQHLHGLTKLEMLGLSGTRISDGGLQHLKKLTNLKSLWLTSTKVTTAGVKALERSLPNVKVRY